MSSDLQRILGYADAVPDDDHKQIELLGTDIVVTPFWTAEFCATVVRAAQAMEVSGAFAADPDDPVPGHEVSLAVISPRLFEAVQDDVGRRLWPRLRTVWPYIDYYGLRDAFIITYSEDGQRELRVHHDVAQLSMSIKLNDGYTGGELQFPRQGVDNAAVPVGHALAWPALVTHPHLSAPLTGGVKYSLTIWCELPTF